MTNIHATKEYVYMYIKMTNIHATMEYVYMYILIYIITL